MGTYNKGILGAFSGKVGPVVGATWRGKDVLRSLPRKGKRALTETQVLQRLKFKTVTAFLMPLQPIIGKYYGSNNTDRTRRNQAMSYHMIEATNYVDPNFEILYNKVQISRGDLLGVQNPTATAAAATSIDFAWTNNAGQGQAKATDKVILAMYEPTTKTTVYSLNAGDRSDGTANFILPAYLTGLTVQVWMTIASSDDKLYATSVYLGDVVLT